MSNTWKVNVWKRRFQHDDAGKEGFNPSGASELEQRRRILRRDELSVRYRFTTWDEDQIRLNLTTRKKYRGQE
jgi:hypothetical protein